MTAIEPHQLESFYPSSTSRQPVTMQQPETAKNVKVYVNGDKYNPGRRFVVNRRHVQNFDGFLNMVTNGLKPSFGAVRHIYTPNHGHKVTQLEGINSGMAIVAGGSERFRKLAYQEITSPTRRQQQKPRADHTIEPVYHSKMNVNVPARWKEVPRGPCNIYVYGNGDINGAAVRLLLIPRIMKRWDLVLQEITEKIAFRTGQACRKLYTIEGEFLSGSDQLENGRYYVSVGSERFKRLPYGERAKHNAMIASTRKPTRKVTLPPIRRVQGKPGDSSYSQKYAARRQLQEEYADQSQPPPPKRTQPPRRPRPSRASGFSERGPPSEQDSVFHAKPVKVKRSPATGKLTQVNSENNDDVYRAKRREIEAEEIADDPNVYVDLPIDQVPARTVDEEEQQPDSSRRGGDSETRHQQPTPEVRQTYAPRIDEDDSDLTAPSKTPTSARKDDEPPTARSEQSDQKRAGSLAPSARTSDSPQKEISEDKTKADAAIVIQSHYRGYRSRNNIKSQREAEKANQQPSYAYQDDSETEEQPRASPPLDNQPTVAPEKSGNPNDVPERSAGGSPVQTAVIQRGEATENTTGGNQTPQESRDYDNASRKASKPASPLEPSETQGEPAQRQPSPPQEAIVNESPPHTTNTSRDDEPQPAQPDTTNTRESPTRDPEPADHDDQPSNNVEYHAEQGDERAVESRDETAALPRRDDGDGTDDGVPGTVDPEAWNSPLPDANEESGAGRNNGRPDTGTPMPSDVPRDPMTSENQEETMQDGQTTGAKDST